jgi:hypothetical protein
MKYRRIRLGLAAACACWSLAGCEWHRQGLRSADSAQQQETSESDSAKGAEVKSDAPRGFFKATRLPGAMSDEGREIERDLGIP